MNKKRIAQYCCAALVASGIGLNIQNALSDYGIGENSLSLVAVGPGSNSGSNSNSNSNWNSNSDTLPDISDSDSDSNGGGNNATDKYNITFPNCPTYEFPGTVGEQITVSCNGQQYVIEVKKDGKARFYATETVCVSGGQTPCDNVPCPIVTKV